jgi:hypothetical protein
MCFPSPSTPHPTHTHTTSHTRGTPFVVIKIHFFFLDHGAAALNSVTVVKWKMDSIVILGPISWRTQFSNSLTNSGKISFSGFRLSGQHIRNLLKNDFLQKMQQHKSYFVPKCFFVNYNNGFFWA